MTVLRTEGFYKGQKEELKRQSQPRKNSLLRIADQWRDGAEAFKLQAKWKEIGNAGQGVTRITAGFPGTC